MPEYTHPGVTVSVGQETVTVEATNGALHDWATRIGSEWPCSMLKHCTEFSACLDASGLLDLHCPGAHDLDCTEFNAFTSDVIAYVLAPSHPCHYVTVGQFQE